MTTMGIIISKNITQYRCLILVSSVLSISELGQTRLISLAVLAIHKVAARLSSLCLLPLGIKHRDVLTPMDNESLTDQEQHDGDLMMLEH